MEPLIRLHGVTKIYRTDEIETQALQGLDLAVWPQDFVAISGPSGCGKSTLLAILGLLDTPSAGSYVFDGVDVARADARERARLRNERIGFVFQAFNLVDELSVFDNVALQLRYRRGPVGGLRDKVMQALEAVDLVHRAKHRPGQLSGGQQQRVAIARALVAEPRLLLVDEPTGNLDSHNADAVMALLRATHARGTTLVMVTHEERFARQASTRLHLLDGRLLAREQQEAA